MTEIANFTDRRRQEVSIDKLNNGRYCVTVDGRMTQKDLTADNLVAWFANASQTNREKATYDELVDVLRTTRKLVSQAAIKGFDDDDSIGALYRNNGAITRVVPLRPQDREETSKYAEENS